MRNKTGVYVNQIPKRILLKRLLWNICSPLLFRLFPTRIFWRWNRFLLKIFGATLGRHSIVHSSCEISCPWNIKLGTNSCIGPHCIIENDALVKLGDNATVSQYSYLCTSSHDIYHKGHDLIFDPIIIGNDAWVGAGSFLGRGVNIGDGAIVAARSVVVKSFEPWNIVGGNPARFIKKHIIVN